LSRIDASIPVYFINTGYHFPETVAFKDQIADSFGLNIKEVMATVPRNMQKDASGNFLFTSNPDYCCHINKVEPMEPVLSQYDVWINGVRADQSDTRKNFNIEEKTPFGGIRFHPMLDWNMRMIYAYIKEHQLPRHPLEQHGYYSIGCEPCTRKMDADMEQRQSRWYGMKKTECGLNTDLVAK
jgi:phosphoadenosine phosphosulfate reductase